MTHLTIINAQETQEGDGVTVKRLMPAVSLRNYDPFVLMDHFTLQPGTGFSDHPHRGFEAITYLFSGSMQHTDNLGNQSTVESGGAQRFTAGKGIVHSEMPSEDSHSEGIQLWINLPQRLKRIEPAYQQVNRDQFTIIKKEGIQRQVLVGDDSPLQVKTEVRYEDIYLNSSHQWNMPLNPSFHGFIYLIRGQLKIAEESSLHTGQAAFWDKLNNLKLTAQQDSHFIVCMGLPHQEPIRQHGTFVD